VDSICECDPAISSFDTVYSQCVGLADKSCMGPEDLCTSGAYCENSICKCDRHQDFILTSKGTCGKEYGKDCNRNCADGMFCQNPTPSYLLNSDTHPNDKCVCEFGEHENLIWMHANVKD